MKVALVQMDVIPGNPKRNLATMLRLIDTARNEQADLVVFPELCLSGYILADLWVDPAFLYDLMQYNDDLLEASQGIALAYGNVFLDTSINARWKDAHPHPNKDGRPRKYNAVYVLQDRAYAKRSVDQPLLPQGVQPKTLLPNYRIYDDERYFFSLQDIADDAGVPLEHLHYPFIIKTGSLQQKVGFEICEDLWCQDYRRHGAPLNPTNNLIAHGAEIVVNLSSSPWNEGKNSSRDRRILFLKEQAGDQFVPFLYVNRTGTENNGKNIITYDGGSTVYNAAGKPVRFAGKAYTEEILYATKETLDGPALQRKEEPGIEQKFDAILQGIRHFELLTGTPLRFVTGLSGGIDSAVVASLLSVACGCENVVAINMPSKYNSTLTKQNARAIADNLGIAYHLVPIDKLSDLNRSALRELDKLYSSPDWMRALSDENIQAKVRGTSILSNIAGRYGLLMSNNGNKLEIALGYATLYGDVNGAVAPIGDLTKSEVYQMARYLNEVIFKREVIPGVLLPDEFFRFRKDQIVPSPELKEGQINPMKFGYHCALLRAFTNYTRTTPEEILRHYLEGTLEKELGIRTELITRWALDNPEVFVNDLDWFVAMIRKSTYKRIQAPPIIITSKSAYGYDLRESMLSLEPTARYSALRAQVMKMTGYASRSSPREK